MITQCINSIRVGAFQHIESETAYSPINGLKFSIDSLKPVNRATPIQSRFEVPHTSGNRGMSDLSQNFHRGPSVASQEILFLRDFDSKPQENHTSLL